MSDNRKHLLLWLVLICILSLACNLSELANPFDEPASQVEIVDVSPDVGTGKFTIAVTYYWAKRNPKYEIFCAYPETFVGLNSSTPLPVKKIDRNTITFTALATKPGTYTLICTDSQGTSAQDVFTVEEEKPPLEATTPKLVKNPKPGDFTRANMGMDWSKSISDFPNAPNFFPRICLPSATYSDSRLSGSFNIDKSGAITGSCQGTNFGGAETYLGSMSGKWDEVSGKITFTLQVTTVYIAATSRGQSGKSTSITILAGSTAFSSETIAKGTATWLWNVECTTSDPTTIKCPEVSTASGTVPVVIEVIP